MKFRRFKDPVLIPAWSQAAKYQFRYSLILASIPILCALALLSLFSVFAELNLYFLEASGFIVNNYMREAYFDQVTLEMLNVVGYLGLQVVVTLLASIVILRWATAPFVSAQANLRAAINDESLRASRRWHSEIPAFDRTIRLFAESLRAGQKQTEHRNLFSMSNYPFLLKFVATFTILSLSTGYVMSILVDSAYRRIIDITVQVVKTTPQMAHYFLTQQDALHRVNFLTMAISLALYFCVGLRISNYMMNMALMFTRAIHQDRFPISLRADDLYQDLATTLNEARSKHQRGRNEKL